jgi:hypothetical protein
VRTVPLSPTLSGELSFVELNSLLARLSNCAWPKKTVTTILQAVASRTDAKSLSNY